MWSNKIIRYTIISVLSIIVLVYLAMVLTSIDTFYPGTIINGKDYGFKSPAYVENAMYENPADFKFEIKFRDKTEVLSGDRIGYNIDYRSYLDQIKREQNPFLSGTSHIQLTDISMWITRCSPLSLTDLRRWMSHPWSNQRIPK